MRVFPLRVAELVLNELSVCGRKPTNGRRRLTRRAEARTRSGAVAAALSAVEQLVELGIVEGVGNGGGRRYMLSSKVYALTGDEIGYTRQKGMTVLQEEEIIGRHIEKFGKITRAEVAELCKCDLEHAYYLLRKMADEGRVKTVNRGRYSYYADPASKSN